MMRTVYSAKSAATGAIVVSCVCLLWSAHGCRTTRADEDVKAAEAAVPTGPPRLRGQVVGPDRAGLHGVKVTTDPPTDAVLSYRGKYEIARVLETDSALSPGRYALVFSKLGWSAKRVTVDYPGGDFQVPVIEMSKPGGPKPTDLGVPSQRTETASGQGPSREGE